MAHGKGAPISLIVFTTLLDFRLCFESILEPVIKCLKLYYLFLVVRLTSTTFSFLSNALIKIFKYRMKTKPDIIRNQSFQSVFWLMPIVHRIDLKFKLADHENPQELTSFNDNEIHTEDCQAFYFV